MSDLKNNKLKQFNYQDGFSNTLILFSSNCYFVHYQAPQKSNATAVSLWASVKHLDCDNEREVDCFMPYSQNIFNNANKF